MILTISKFITCCCSKCWKQPGKHFCPVWEISKFSKCWKRSVEYIQHVNQKSSQLGRIFHSFPYFLCNSINHLICIGFIDFFPSLFSILLDLHWVKNSFGSEIFEIYHLKLILGHLALCDHWALSLLGTQSLGTQCLGHSVTRHWAAKQTAAPSTILH